MQHRWNHAAGLPSVAVLAAVAEPTTAALVGGALMRDAEEASSWRA